MAQSWLETTWKFRTPRQVKLLSIALKEVKLNQCVNTFEQLTQLFIFLLNSNLAITIPDTGYNIISLKATQGNG